MGGGDRIMADCSKDTTLAMSFIGLTNVTRRELRSSTIEQTRKNGEKIDEPRDITILVVDDEPMVLRMAVSMLKRLGYVVLAAKTPDQAIQIARESCIRIDLLLVDLIMPEMNGRELAEHLLKIQTRMKVLYMSGYTADIISNLGILEEGVFFIEKPFSKNDLAARIQAALTRRTNSD
jgi:two-component system cell cycle sensor histidine kinase/response regulator CckA